MITYYPAAVSPSICNYPNELILYGYDNRNFIVNSIDSTGYVEFKCRNSQIGAIIIFDIGTSIYGTSAPTAYFRYYIDSSNSSYNRLYWKDATGTDEKTDEPKYEYDGSETTFKLEWSEGNFLKSYKNGSLVSTLTKSSSGMSLTGFVIGRLSLTQSNISTAQVYDFVSSGINLTVIGG